MKMTDRQEFNGRYDFLIDSNGNIFPGGHTVHPNFPKGGPPEPFGIHNLHARIPGNTSFHLHSNTNLIEETKMTKTYEPNQKLTGRTSGDHYRFVASDSRRPGYLIVELCGTGRMFPVEEFMLKSCPQIGDSVTQYRVNECGWSIPTTGTTVVDKYKDWIIIAGSTQPFIVSEVRIDGEWYMAADFE